jgi:hypothetical protein
MSILKFLGKDIIELKYIKNIPKPTGKLVIENSFNGKFSESDQKSFCDVYVSVHDENSNEISINLRLIGIFEYDIAQLTEEDKRNIEIEMYHRMYPLWSSIINSVFLIIGIPPITISLPKMEEDQMDIDSDKHTPVN